jgi:hypothetical protein
MTAIPPHSALLLSLVPLFAGVILVDPMTLGQQVTRLVNSNEVIFRVPVAPRPAQQSVRWVEADGPKCVPMRAIRGALLSGRRNVDFVLSNRRRVRAKVDDDCPALDFYAGLYLEPEDQFLCARRDSIYSRMGGNCRIRGFKQLEPQALR